MREVGEEGGEGQIVSPFPIDLIGHGGEGGSLKPQSEDDAGFEVLLAIGINLGTVEDVFNQPAVFAIGIGFDVLFVDDIDDIGLAAQFAGFAGK